MGTKWWKKNNGGIYCPKCEAYNYRDRTSCYKCAAALPQDPGAIPGPGKQRGAGGRWAAGPPEACSPEYALEIIKNTFGQAEADRLKATAEAAKTHKEPDNNKQDIGQMQAAADAARKALGDEGAAHLDKLVEEARRKKQEAKKPHLRVRDAEVKLENANRANVAAQSDLEAKQTQLQKALAQLAGTQEKVNTAQTELQEIKANVYKDEAADENLQSKAKAAHEGLAQLRAQADLSPAAKQALAAVEAGLRDFVQPPPPEAPAQGAQASGHQEPAPQEDVPMPAFDELPSERVQFLTRKWGEGEEAAAKAKDAWETMRQVHTEEVAAKRQRSRR